jgi:hypothetical protein
VHVFRPEHDLSFTGISRSGAAAQRIDNHGIWIIFLCIFEACESPLLLYPLRRRERILMTRQSD